MIQIEIILLTVWRAVVLVLLGILVLMVPVVFSINKWYCYVFEHKSWVLWEKVCKVLLDAKLVKYHHWDEYPELESYHVPIQNPDEDGVIDVVYWVKQDCVSVHKETECILSDFDKYHSTKAVEIIRSFLL